MDKNILRKIKRRDRVARWVITVGGMAIIFSVIFILILIARVSLPLFQEPSAEVFSKFALPPEAQASGVRAVGMDEYLETGYLLDGSGVFWFVDLDSGEVLKKTAALPPKEGGVLKGVEKSDGLRHELLWSDGSLTVEQVRFRVEYDEKGERIIHQEVSREATFDPGIEVPVRSLARAEEEGRETRVDLLPGNRLQILQKEAVTDFLGNTEEEIHSVLLEGDFPGEVTALALDRPGQTLYAGTANGFLLRWSLSEAGEPELLDRIQAFSDQRRISALGLVLGDISLAVGDEKGGVTTWFPVRSEKGGEKSLRLIHRLTSHPTPVVTLIPSRRDKSVLSLDAGGTVHLDHMTSERHLLALENHSPLVLVAFSGRADGIFAVNEEGRGILWAVDNPHPEVSFRTLFGEVWYESYNEPDHVWQSSAANDDFEPKLSLVPLIFGTMKGTFYAMLFAVPLALFGAIYTSQFASAGIRKWIKPTVEIMAAIPSVIIGFLAALWLAPLIDRSLGGLFLSIIFIPLALVLAILAWQWVRRLEPLQRLERGYEFLVIGPILVLAVALAATLGPLAENLLFGGDIKQWLFREWGSRYDQRNNIIIAFALGFAVIPIIFTIAEDALSNVPSSIRAASLALGASRWQTVWRVILPSASPGIFAGSMIGFGRAVGETMIVLMATGNTPILDWSIFNGMRPLSANIAVEIPEAPVGGTLYRVLFLSAVILFLMTFIVNTAAELVRQRLRKKYGRF